MSNELARVQAEHKPWQKRNFPDQQAWQPLLGIVEELGELDDAISADDFKGVLDSIADVMIYIVNYSNLRGWNVQHMWDLRASIDDQDPLGMIGKLCHHHLKWSQGIRGPAAKHESESQRVLRGVLAYLEHVLQGAQDEADSATVPSITLDVWVNEVSKRDWRKPPAHADH